MKMSAVFLFLLGTPLAQNPTLIDSLKNQLKGTPDSTEQRLLLDLAWEYSFSNLDTAEYFARQGISLSLMRNDESDLASSREMLAIIHDIRGSVDKAAVLFLQAATYYENQKLYENLSSTYNNMGALFFNYGDMDKSWIYYEKSMVIDVLLGDSIGVAASMINLAAVTDRKGNYDIAARYLARGERIVELLGDDNWVKQSIYEGLGNNYLYKEQFDSSLIYFEKLLPLYKKDNDHYNTLSCLNGLIQAWIGLRGYKNASQLLVEAEKLSVKYDDIILKKKRYEVASLLFEGVGNFEKALGYQKLYQTLSDSVTNQERLKTTNELEQKYQSELKEKEIAELEIEQQKSTNQRNVLILVAGILVVSAILLFLLLRTKSKSNTIISKSLNEKEVLLKEIHHRVKNNLQVISSLLSLQSRYIEDENVQAAMNESQNRVKSMALIHQKLYQHDNLLGVEALDYIQNLTSTLEASYGIDSNKIEVKYEVDDLNIDVDTIIPIGLILNELISNVFKHAFPDGKKGELLIGLKEEEGSLKLMVQDNGVGSTKDLEKTDSFGMRMIGSLAMKLEAEVNFNFVNGTQASIAISNYKLN